MINKFFQWLFRDQDLEYFSHEYRRYDYKKLTEMLKRHEGLRLALYKCSANKLTIGYGRNLEDRGISHDEAALMLENDIEICIEEAQRFSWFYKLNWARQDVVLDMLFNLGLSRFLTFKKMLLSLENADYFGASKEMLDSKWARQVGVRANTLSQMMASGSYARNDSHFRG